MTDAEATSLLTRLAAAYPAIKAGKDTVAVYREALLPLDHALAQNAVDGWLRTERFFPSISEFREAYTAARRARDAARPRSPEPPREPPPDYVWVWRWAIDTGQVPADALWPFMPRDDPFDLPTVGELEQPVDALGNDRDRHIVTEAAYTDLHAAWVEAGQPHPNLLAPATKTIPEPADV